MPAAKRFPPKAHQAKTARRKTAPEHRRTASGKRPYVLAHKHSTDGTPSFIADLAKLKPAPIVTADPKKALTFKDRSGPFYWLRRHPQARKTFVSKRVD